MSKRKRILIALLVIAVVALVLPTLHSSHGHGRYDVSVQLKSPPEVRVAHAAYMGFFQREFAEFVRDSPDVNQEFTVADLDANARFEARIEFSQRSYPFGIEGERRQEHLLVLQLEMTDGTERRMIVEVPDMQNPKDRSLVVRVEPTP